MDWRDYIVSTPGIIKGKPRIRNTRIPVSLVLGYLTAGNTIDEIIEEFPDLKLRQVYQYTRNMLVKPLIHQYHFAITFPQFL